MSASVVLMVLFAALLHAGWNTAVKSGHDKSLNAVLVSAGAGAIAALGLCFVEAPSPASWPYLACSVCAQVIYYRLVAAAYRHGDLSQAYPLMRGTAPLLVALASAPLLGESLSLTGWGGVLLICSGVLGLAVDAWLRDGVSARATGLALLNACVIASYTLIDGVGVRLSQAPVGYTLWIFFLTAIPLLGWTLFRRPRELLRYARSRPALPLVGGSGTLGSYGIALYAMTLAPVASVAALRETSILFATLLSVLLLGERIGPRRGVATAFIAAGAMVIRLA
ncbi:MULTISPECIES: DMT family transporter [Pseudomonas]|uniref:DMT family transporter n=1 Tax=Pseudomonas TaxID=286 RepID=UPI00249A841C|nr:MULTISPECIES: DMT family transporter [Pseudomonas]